MSAGGSPDFDFGRTHRNVPTPLPTPADALIWHVSASGQTVGPGTVHQIRRLAASGVIPSSALVWKGGMTDWGGRFRKLLSLRTTPCDRRPRQLILLRLTPKNAVVGRRQNNATSPNGEYGRLTRLRFHDAVRVACDSAVKQTTTNRPLAKCELPGGAHLG